MNASDRTAFAELLTGVMGFYRRDVSAFGLGVWWEACQRFDMEQVRKAFTAHAMDPDRGQFEPKPADIVRQLQGTHTDRALLAWGKVFEAMQSVGSYATVDFGDPAVHAAITDMGGWPTLCRSDLDDLPFIQKRFCDSYRTYAARGTVDAPLRLTGHHDQVNAAMGYHRESEPVRIGGPKVVALPVPSRPPLPHWQDDKEGDAA